MKKWILLLLVVTTTASQEMPPQINQVYEGEPFNITIRVWNHGSTPNHATIVYFDNATTSESVIGWQEIDFEPNSPTWTSIIWNATGIGIHRIYISIENPESDTNNQNNIASKEINVIPNENKTKETTTTTEGKKTEETTATTEEPEKEDTSTTARPRLDDYTTPTPSGDNRTTESINQRTTTTLEETGETTQESTTTTRRGRRASPSEAINYVLVFGALLLVYLSMRKKRIPKNDYEDYDNPERDNRR